MVSRVENLVGLRVLEVNITVDDVLVPEERPQPGRRRELEEDAQEQEQQQAAGG